MGGHGSSLNRAVSLKTYSKPFSSGRAFVNTIGHLATDGVTAGTAELIPKYDPNKSGLINEVAKYGNTARDHAGDIVFGAPTPPAPSDPGAGAPSEPLPGSDPNGPPTGAAPNPTQASEMAALKRRRLLRMGLLSTITTSPSGLTDAPNLLMPTAGSSNGQTLLG